MNNSPSTKQQLRAQAEWLAAIGEPTRITIICDLSAGKKIVTDLARGLSRGIVNVSQHLKVLKRAGIVADERDGRRMWYSLVGMKAIAREIVLTHESGMRAFFTPSDEATAESESKKPASKKGKK